MSLKTLDPTRWLRGAIACGAILWTLLALASGFGWLALGAPDLVLLLALGVIAPLALSLVPPPTTSQSAHNLYRAAILLHPIAALIGGVSFLLRPGPLAAAAASAWLVYTALLALFGIAWLLDRTRIALPDVCLAAAVIYLPVGGAWLALSRLGARPLGFSPTTILLTAVHFHFITLAALAISGLTGRVVRATGGARAHALYRVAALGMLVNPLLVAAGITLTQLSGVRILETLAATLMALGLMVIALLSLRIVVPATTPLLARGLLLVSGGSVLATMLIAVAYAVGTVTGAWTITVTQMIAVHGWVNATAFGLCGLLGWRLRASLCVKHGSCAWR